MKKTNKRGFTLIELMIVVAIIGILAAVAIPAFMNYMKRAKTSEATLNLKSIAEGAVSYHDTHGNTLPTTTAVTPDNNPKGAGYTISATIDELFNSDGWQQIGWKPHKNFLYAYQYTQASNTDGVGVVASATAWGDLDDDDVNSVFTRDLEKLSSGLLKPNDVSVTAELE